MEENKEKQPKKKRVVTIVDEILEPFFREKGYILYHREFVKEASNWFLRVFIEKAPEEGEMWPTNVTAQDCEIVSKYLGKELDRLDPIAQNYYLEVSSPGMDRPLLTQAHYMRYEGHLVDIRLYRAMDGKKTVRGTIKPHSQGVNVLDEAGNTYEIEYSQIAAANLVIEF